MRWFKKNKTYSLIVTTEDPRPQLHVEADYNPDDIRCFYEIPSALVSQIRPPDAEKTFVEYLANYNGESS